VYVHVNKFISFKLFSKCFGILFVDFGENGCKRRVKSALKLINAIKWALWQDLKWKRDPLLKTVKIIAVGFNQRKKKIKIPWL
jgi:hypothetical protein